MNRLREIRQGKNVTQFELGKNVNVHPQKISEFEHGRRDLRLSEAVKAAQFLGVSLDELAGLNEKSVLASQGGDASEQK